MALENSGEVGFTTIKNAKEYDNLYCVSPKGTVVSPSYIDKSGKLRKKRTLKPQVRGKGYHYVGLMKNGKQKGVSIHRLVAEAFIPNPENKPEVNHKDGNKTNNCVENLEWVTSSENALHAFNKGLRTPKDQIGENNTMAKLDNNKVLLIKKSKDSAKKLANKYNVSKSTIYKIRQGLRWADV